MEVLAALAIASGFGALVWKGTEERRQRSRFMAELASLSEGWPELDLEARGPQGRLLVGGDAGTLDLVRERGRQRLQLSLGARSLVDLRVHPRDLRVRHSVFEDALPAGDTPFDQRYLVRSSDKGLAGALLGPELRAALLALDPLDLLVVEEGELHLTRTGPLQDPAALEPVLRAVLALRALLAEGIRPCWRAFAEAHALAPHNQGYAGSVRRWTARLLLRRQDESCFTELHLALPGPAGLRVTHAQPGPLVGDPPAPSFSLGDPVLDLCLRAGGEDPEAARRWLARPEVVEPLLELVHGQPEATVEATGLTLRWPGVHQDPEPGLELLLALAEALDPPRS